MWAWSPGKRVLIGNISMGVISEKIELKAWG